MKMDSAITVCPVSGQTATTTETRKIEDGDCRYIWWRCDQCGGWHVNARQQYPANQPSKHEVVADVASGELAT